VTDERRAPRDDAELAARIEEITRPAPFAGGDCARFAAGVRARTERSATAPPSWLPAFGVGAAAAALALALGLGARDSAPAPSARAELAPATLGDSWQEEVLYAPEWIESDDGFLDEEVLPQDYAVAAALLDS
jgi:hypothetical protein